jgi:hypothetical protein
MRFASATSALQGRTSLTSNRRAADVAARPARTPCGSHYHAGNWIRPGGRGHWARTAHPPRRLTPKPRTESRNAQDHQLDLHLARRSDRESAPIVQYGFGQLSFTLMKHELLDELRLWMHPPFVGSAQPDDLLYRECPTAAFELVDTRALRNGIAILTNRVCRDQRRGPVLTEGRRTARDVPCRPARPGSVQRRGGVRPRRSPGRVSGRTTADGWSTS